MRLVKIGMLLAVSLSLFGVAGYASPFTTAVIRTTCLSPSTAGAYATGSLVCDTGNVDSWLEFSGFTSTGAGNNLRMQALANSMNQGFYFPTNLSGQSSFTVGFNLQAFNELADGLTFHVTSSAQARSDASVTMNVCVGQVVGCSPANQMSLTLGAASIQPIQTINFAATPTLGITFTGNVDVNALLSQFEVGVITVPGSGGTGGSGGATGDLPEPSTWLTMGIGLLGLAAARLRRNS